MRSSVLSSLLLISFVLALPAVLPAAEPAAPAADAAARLHDLFAREWEWRLAENPLLATSVGRHEYDHLLPSVAHEDELRRAAATRAFLAELATIDRGALGAEDAASYLIFERQLANRVAEVEFGDHELPITAETGFHTGVARLEHDMPLRTVADYENYLARLAALPQYFEQNIANMRRGLARGMTVPREVLDGFEVTIDSHVVEDPEESVFYPPFRDYPSTVPVAERARLTAAGRQAILDGPVAAYRAFSEFFTEEYRPGARPTTGASELPDGKAYYEYLIRRYTTLDLSAEEIHRIGLAEVARIRSEMQGVIDRLGFEGDFAAFLDHLRTDPRFYPRTPEELLERAAWIAKRMDGQLPALFGRLPRLPYTVEPVPPHLAPKYTTGRYVGAPQGSTQPGRYWVNTYRLDQRPFYNMEALTLHEAVPGHHLQNALADELDNLPPFRRYSYISAFGEGWGLYSEWLGIEAGFYTDPYSDFGRLTYEMWRAARLVVDTGLHAKGWTRQQVMDFLAANTALPLHEVTTETDRYISWPGQALSYKIGELTIRRLRREAETALGDAFDLRAFHDTVLGAGSVPLPVLEENVARWVAAEKKG